MSKGRVLVVDDELGFRELMALELSAKGYEVVTAANGDEAVEKAQAQRFDLMISDMTMPRRGGLDTLSAVKALDASTEVIMVTGYATLENAVESMRRGAYDFITKPFQMDDLLRLADRALEKRSLSAKIGELQEINRFKSEFLANMSHELRTPMNAILGYTSLHAEGIYGPVSPKQEEALRRVETAGKNLLQLINSVLDLSKVSAGRMPVYHEDFLLADVTDEVVSMVDCLAKAKSLSLECRAPKDLRVRTDKTKLKQILINLVTNAIKFTSQGGVTIEAGASSGGADLVLSVRDTGIGIEAKDLDSLFQEFKQLDSSSTRAYGGTGLGLVISKRFAELLGGDVTAASEPGKGTTFTISLPARPRSEAPQEAPAPEGAAGGAKVLLAIDDDPEVLRLVRDSLQGTEFGFIGARSAEEGLELARGAKPCAITLDIMMPRRDGWSVLQALKEDPHLKQIPVIMMSILENKTLGFALGVADYIVKPFERRDLLSRLRAVEQGRETDPAEPCRSVLVVDDEVDAAECLAETLKAQGYSVSCARGGREALRRLLEGPRPDLLFLDIMMPEVSGFDVLEAIADRPELRDLPVIILTAKPLTAQEMELLQKRVKAVIQKGARSLADILAVVKRLEARDHALHA